MRYVRICLGGESGEPGMTLYELDASGWVHRHVQLHATGSRFSPEDILMCRPVLTEAMCRHPAADEIDRAEFDMLWNEIAHERTFLQRVPDPTECWATRVYFGRRVLDLLWSPADAPGGNWRRVPGFSQLWVRGDAASARAACGYVFTQPAIEWIAVRMKAA